MGKDFHDCDSKDCCFLGKDCKDDKCDFVKDRACCCWSVPEGQSQDVYIAVGVKVFGSGFISYDCGDAPSITVKFFKDGNPVGSGAPFTVFKGSCLTFTAANFNRIQVTCPTASSPDGDHACTGKICFTPRYQVTCDNDEQGGCC